MTGNPEITARLSDFNTARASLTMTEKKNKSVMHEMKVENNLESLQQDSLDQSNQLTTRE